MTNKQPWLSTFVSDELYDAVQAVSVQFGVSKHKVTKEAIALGLELAKYKIALEKVVADKLNFVNS